MVQMMFFYDFEKMQFYHFFLGASCYEKEETIKFD